MGPGAVTMMAYPMQRMEAFKQQGNHPMQFFGLCLRVSLAWLQEITQLLRTAASTVYNIVHSFWSRLTKESMSTS